MVRFRTVSFCKLLNAPADRMVKKTFKYDFQTILHSIARLVTEHWHVSEIEKMGPKKIRKKLSADIPFSQFSFLALSSHWYQHWVKVALACFETCWNSVRKARRTNFWRKVRSQCGDAKNFARKGPAQNKSPDCLLCNALEIVCRTWIG